MVEHSDVGVEFRAAPPLLLHPPEIRRTDSNSPLLRRGGNSLCFVSHYLPRGHTLRALEGDGMWPSRRYEPVRILADPEPGVGKWIESVWRSPDGSLYAWYQGEELAPCEARIFLPHIAALRSDDEGRSWRLLGPILRLGLEASDCSYRNGFFAGGYGDFCVVADAKAEWFYLHYSSYIADEALQGIAVLRYPVAARDRPAAIEMWRDGRWQPRESVTDGTPILPVARGLRHPDPAAHWGPAVHFNSGIGLHVMLLNWTEGGAGDLVQRGVSVCFNADLADPAGWSPPRRIVEHGSWYPQAIGTGPDDGDTSAGAEARFFMSGYSAWTICFRRGAGTGIFRPLTVTRQNFTELFGAAPW